MRKRAFLVAQTVKNLPEMWRPGFDPWVLSLGREDSLEKKKETHSNIPSWRIPWTEEPGGLQSMGSQTVRSDQVTKDNTMRGNKKETAKEWGDSVGKYQTLS